MNIRPLIGLLGILIAALNAELNEFVLTSALADVRGALGISHDAGLWIESLYASGMAIGMALAPWLAVTFSMRRVAIFAIGVTCTATLCLPFSPTSAGLFALRFVQGLGAGFTIPLLMMTALRVLSPPIRLYGLAIYALTATFSLAISPTLSVLWTDHVGWRFVFFEAAPLGAAAATLVWHGIPQDPARYERLRQFDWRGAVLLAGAAGSFTTLMYHGAHHNWFNSTMVCVLVALCAVSFPLLVWNEWFHPLPLLKFQLLARRNFAYGVVGLFLFLILSMSSSLLPQTYLGEIQGYRASEAHWITLIIAMVQPLMLPATAYLLDHRWADSRVVTVVGLLLIVTACIGSAHLDANWNRDQFYIWQFLQALGQPLVVLPLLMKATNAVKGPEEGPFASALVNTTRSLAAPVGVAIVEIIQQERGAFHSDRIVDQIGRARFIAAPTPSDLLITQRMSSAFPVDDPTEHLRSAARATAEIMAIADSYYVIACVGLAMGILVFVLAVRTHPPRILFAKH